MARRYSSEYKALQPYVVEDARKVANAVLAGASGGSGSMEVHALNGTYHSGELAQSQASWAATKVELSNHAALPDVHHARSHSITSSSDHTVTGSQYQIVGLTSTNTLGLLTAASSPTANQVVKTDSSSAVTLVDLTVSSDLFMTGTLDFGTDTMYEDASYLQVAGSKPVRFGQNIGNANWTVYSTGGAQFGGSVDIVSGGDLTVAGSGSYAGSNVLFADSSGGNVGIMMAPDSQFALDINGPARATYWIGPHAIQLKNVLLLSHFDGRAPYNNNYSGEPNGHMGQVATVAGGLIYRPGKFYKAMQVAQSAYNFCPNPRSANNTTGWSKQYDGGTLTSMARLQNDDAPYGSYVVSMTASASSNYVYNAPHFHAPDSVTMTWNSGETATLSCYVWGAGTWRIVFEDSGQNLDAYQDVTLSATDAWQRVVITKTNSGGSSYSAVRLAFFPRSAGCNIHVNGIQYENIARATPYIDGTLGGEPNGHGWNGTEHASYSYRNAGQLSYTQAMPRSWTIMFWAYRASWQTGILSYLLGWGSGSVYYTSAGLDVVGPITSTAPTDGWHHYCVMYDTAGITRAYRDGAYLGQSSAAVTTASTMYVGWNGSAAYCNSWIDDLCLLERAMDVAADNSCDELRSVYESNAPVFAETSTFSFRPTPKGLIWADDEGLWMRDSAGKSVFGIYGGESTKSWGGFTMAPGDLLIGNNAVGSSAIWWDQSAGTFGFYGAGSATAQASVATDGSITAGAGALALNSSGIQITAPSTQTSIGSYKFLVTGKTITSGMYAYFNSGADTYYHGLFSDSSDIGNITTVIGSNLGGGGTSKIQFVTTNNLAVTSTSYTLTSSTSTWWFGDGSLVYVGIGTAAAPTRSFQVAGGVFVGGEETGLAGYTQITNATQGVSSGTGTVKVNGTTARDSTGWLKIYVGTSVRYIPYWTTVTG